MEFRRITDHVYWMAPAAPDRPSLCAVVGAERVAMLDAGASCAHARQFLQELESHGVAHPDYVLLTHWHWDHVFGAAAIGGELIAHRRTAGKLATLSLRDWSDAGLERQVANGLETPLGAENIRAELPEPRMVRVVEPQVVFEDQLELRLGGVSCQIMHVGGDHSEDSSVILVSVPLYTVEEVHGVNPRKVGVSTAEMGLPTAMNFRYKVSGGTRSRRPNRARDAANLLHCRLDLHKPH